MRDLQTAKFWSRSRVALAALAAVYAAWTILYSVLWMTTIDWLPPVELGFENNFSESERVLPVTRVVPDSPAERAGLRQGDRILAVNHRPIENSTTLHSEYRRHSPATQSA
jgi:predicted metalloprotease with PDZ domain